MDFSEASDVRDKEIKRLNLLEIMDYINNTKNVFNETTFPEITEMVRPAARRNAGLKSTCPRRGRNFPT